MLNNTESESMQSNNQHFNDATITIIRHFIYTFHNLTLFYQLRILNEAKVPTAVLHS